MNIFKNDVIGNCMFDITFDNIQIRFKIIKIYVIY